MKSFFNKLKTLFMFLLIVPLMFVFSACGKDKDDSGSNSGGPSIEQPEGGDSDNSGGDDEGGGGSNPQPEVQAEKFTVAVNYNLPKFYEGILPSENESVLVSEGYTLSTFEGTEYEDYFDGWFYESDDLAVLEQKINAEKDQTVSIYAKWKEDEMNQTFATAGLEFEFAKDDNQRDYAVPVSYSGRNSIVVIPQVVMKDSDTPCYVDTIGANCFKDNTVVKEIRTKMIDFSVKSSAFECSSLEKIDFSKIINIESNAFKNSKVKNAVFSNKLADVAESVFYGCSELEKVDFLSANNSELVDVPSYAFYGCEKLTDVKLSATMTTIGVSSFENCSSLTSFEFIEESSVSALNEKSFAGCVGIENLNIPARIVSYGTGNVFANCAVKNITLEKLWYNSSNGTSATFTRYYGDMSSSLESVTMTGSGIETIYKNYFKNYSNLKTFVMTNSVKSIEYDAFYGCSNLENVTFSTAIYSDNLNISYFYGSKWYDAVKSNDYTIINDTLVSVSKTYAGVDGVFEIPNTVKYLSASLFSANRVLSKITIPESVEYINVKALANSYIENIEVSQNNENYICENGALYELDENKNKVALIAYFSAESGGVYAPLNSVKLIYDYAFDLKNAPDYVLIQGENVEIKFDGASSTKYVYDSDSITSNADPNLVTIYRYLSKETGGYDVVDNAPVFSNYSGLPNCNLVIVDGDDGIYYYLVTINAGGVIVQELDGYCPII